VLLDFYICRLVLHGIIIMILLFVKVSLFVVNGGVLLIKLYVVRVAVGNLYIEGGVIEIRFGQVQF
jgi:hypothetical protein